MESVILQIDKNTYKSIFSFNKKNGIDLSQYVLISPKKHKMNETEYLLSAEANKKILMKSIKEADNPKKLIKIKLEDI